MKFSTRSAATLALFVALMIGSAAPMAAAYQYPYYPSDSGWHSCPSYSHLIIKSYGKGNVGHSVYGQTQGTWNNGSTFMYRTSHTSFTSGQWLAWSDDVVDVSRTYAYCY